MASKIRTFIPLRTRIRETLLKQLAEQSPYRVLDNPCHPLALADLPAVTLRLEKESVVPESAVVVSPGVLTQSYTLPVVVEGWLAGSSSLQSDLEIMAVRLMQALQADPTLGGLCQTLTWESGAEITLLAEGEAPMGCVRLVANLLYRRSDTTLSVCSSY